MATINKRLTVDQALAWRKLSGKKATTANKVRITWSKALENEKDLPKDWIHSTEVLVGTVVPTRSKLKQIPPGTMWKYPIMGRTIARPTQPSRW